MSSKVRHCEPSASVFTRTMTNISPSNLRRSERIGHESYRRRTTWSLPVIVSVTYLYFKWATSTTVLTFSFRRIHLHLNMVFIITYLILKRIIWMSTTVNSFKTMTSIVRLRPCSTYIFIYFNNSSARKWECRFVYERCRWQLWWVIMFFFSIFTSHNLSDDPLFFMARRPYEEPRTRHDLGRMVVKCRSCGSLHWMDEITQGETMWFIMTFFSIDDYY